MLWRRLQEMQPSWFPEAVWQPKQDMHYPVSEDLKACFNANTAPWGAGEVQKDCYASWSRWSLILVSYGCISGLLGTMNTTSPILRKMLSTPYWRWWSLLILAISKRHNPFIFIYAEDLPSNRSERRLPNSDQGDGEVCRDIVPGKDH